MSVVQQVLSWWGAQMRDLVPARLRQTELHADALIADVAPESASIAWAERRGRRETRLPDPQRARLRGRRAARVLLRVPPGAALERTLTLPLQTEPELDRVIGYELDRISPFSVDEVAWTYAVEQRDRNAGRLLVRLALLPRAGLEPALQVLRQLGAAPGSVLAPRDGGGFWVIPLRATEPGQRGAAGQRVVRVLAACCAALAVVAALLPFGLQELALRQEEAAIAALRPAVAEADALRRRIADRAGGSNAVAAEAARTGDMLDAVATLTALLPDDTYLTSLSIRQRVITMAGRSTAATRLIPLLAADPTLRKAAFAAPVTRVQGSRDDVFSIRAEFGSLSPAPRPGM